MTYSTFCLLFLSLFSTYHLSGQEPNQYEFYIGLLNEDKTNFKDDFNLYVLLKNDTLFKGNQNIAKEGLLHFEDSLYITDTLELIVEFPEDSCIKYFRIKEKIILYEENGIYIIEIPILKAIVEIPPPYFILNQDGISEFRPICVTLKELVTDYPKMKINVQLVRLSGWNNELMKEYQSYFTKYLSYFEIDPSYFKDNYLFLDKESFFSPNPYSLINTLEPRDYPTVFITFTVDLN